MGLSTSRRTFDYPRVVLENRDQLRRWFERNHADSQGAWLVTYKKSAGVLYVSKEETLDEAICFGWIDGVRQKLDAERTMQLFTPRRTHRWSATYKRRAERLEEEGRMTDAGRALLAKSKELGLWSSYADADNLVVPPDLEQALETNPAARTFFASYPPGALRSALRWVYGAKRTETRARRIAEIVRKAVRGERVRPEG